MDGWMDVEKRVSSEVCIKDRTIFNILWILSIGLLCDVPSGIGEICSCRFVYALVVAMKW